MHKIDFAVRELGSNNTYKLISACVVPRPIALITSVSPEGVENAAPYSFFNVMGYDPPIVAVGVGNRNLDEPKDTGRNIRRTGEFVVNLVNHEIGQRMNQTAINFPPDISELGAVGFTTEPAKLVAVPRIVESPVHLECVEVTTIERGRTRIVLGEVVNISIRSDLIDQDTLYVATEKADFVGRMHGRGWYTRTTDLFELERIPWDQWKARND